MAAFSWNESLWRWLEVDRGFEPEARQGDLRMDGTIPLLVVGFAQRVDSIGLELAEGVESGRSVGTNRVRRHVRFGRPAVEACSAEPSPCRPSSFRWNDPAGLDWVCTPSGVGPDRRSRQGVHGLSVSMGRRRSDGLRRSVGTDRRRAGVAVRWRRALPQVGAIGPGRAEVAPPQCAEPLLSKYE